MDGRKVHKLWAFVRKMIYVIEILTEYLGSSLISEVVIDWK